MNWNDALRHVCRAYINQPLQYGTRDCCQFAALYVEARTGVDHAAAFRYDSELAAARILKESGGIESLISACIGSPRDGPSVEGDLVACDLAIDAEHVVRTLGINNGTYVWGIHPDDGLCRIPARSIITAWSV